MNSDKITELNSKINNCRNIVITTHENSDGDAIGSSLALYIYYKKKNFNVNVIVPNQYPDFLAWLPSNDDIIIFEKDKMLSSELLSKADIVFCLDVNSIDRTGGLFELLKKNRSVKVLIDHHLKPVYKEFDYVFSEVKTSSTAELIYDFICKSGDISLIDKDIAECLYVGIVTDTGSFSYSCNNSNTFSVVAELVKTGIDCALIHDSIYNSFSSSRIKLLGFTLYERLFVFPKHHAAYIFLSKSDLQKFDFQNGDTEGIVNYPLSIKGINFSVLFTEKDNFVKMSLRSKGNFYVNEFVRENFIGGGHKNASGGRSDLSLEMTIDKFVKLLPLYSEKIKKSF